MTGVLYKWNADFLLSFAASRCRAEEYGWPPDPMWTESNWPSSTPFMAMFLQDSAAMEYIALGVGLAVTAVATAVAVAARMAWRKRQKQD